MSRAEKGSFDELLENRHDRAAPNVLRFYSSGRRTGKTAARLILDDLTRREHLRWKLRRAAPSLLILAGCGCFAVSLWPNPLTLAGCGCFVVATILNLVGCVR